MILENSKMKYYDDKLCKYYPDILIPHKNLLIEVKSTWTYEVKLKKNLEKKAACQKLNYKFEFWIYDRSGNKTVK